MRLRYLLPCAAVFVAAIGHTSTWEQRSPQDKCTGVNSGDKTIVPLRPIGCLSFTSADSTFVFGPIEVGTPVATAEFDPDTGDDAATQVSTGRVNLYWCADGDSTLTTVAGVQNKCTDLGGQNGASALDGTQGNQASQNSYKEVWSGTYYIHVSAACPADKACRVAFSGKQ